MRKAISVVWLPILLAGGLLVTGCERDEIVYEGERPYVPNVREREEGVEREGAVERERAVIPRARE